MIGGIGGKLAPQIGGRWEDGSKTGGRWEAKTSAAPNRYFDHVYESIEY